MASFGIIIILGSLSASAVASAQGSIPLTATPSGLVATPVSANQIDLSWNAPTQNYGKTIVGYKIEQLTGGIYYVIVDNTSSTLTTYSMTGLYPGKTYTFRVSAVYSDDTTTNPSNSSSASLTPSEESILVTTDKSSYKPGDIVSITLHLPKFEQGQTIDIIVTNPSGNILVSKTLTATSQDSSIQIGLPQTAQIGKYKVNATSMYTIFTNPSGWISNSLFKGLDQFTVVQLAISPNDVSIISPLKQFKSGKPMYEIECMSNLQLIVRTSNHTPACVKWQTAHKLFERGSATMILSGKVYHMFVQRIGVFETNRNYSSITYDKVSNQTLSRLPTIQTAMTTADTMYEPWIGRTCRIATWDCGDPTMGAPYVYRTSINADEGQLALKILNAGHLSPYPPSYTTFIQYNMKNYSIMIFS